ncbi:unnamed protein product [Cylindrotheca closterium]|uniref:Kinetochore protein Spc24 n=1 Tax=Cylindrotheca closterium TaxID=2856 RepID=A0AAD2CW91_9STRA|nr:unnamed protein product [Cylindrotheca closterium]
MTSNKRKNGDAFSHRSNGPSVVVVTGLKNEDESFIEQGLHKLHQHLSSEDFLLNAIESIDQGVNRRRGELQEKSYKIKFGLEHQLGQELDACRHESRELVDLEGQIARVKEAQKLLVQKMESLDKIQHGLQSTISKYQEEASHEIDSIDQVEEEQKRLVPRLKTQISLYASTTGIKWNFAQDEMLSGQVCISKTTALQSFCVDPRDYSSVETANRLWKMIDVGA